MKKESGFKMKGFSGFGDSVKSAILGGLMGAKKTGKMNPNDPDRPGSKGMYPTGFETKMPRINKLEKLSATKMKGVPKGSLTTQQFDPNLGKFRKIGDKISKKPASAGQKAVRNFSTSAKQQRKVATKAIGKVGGKIGAKFLGPVGAGLAIKDAIGTVKDIKKGMKPGKAARKNFLGF